MDRRARPLGRGPGPDTDVHRLRGGLTHSPRRPRCRAPAEVPAGAAAGRRAPRPWSVLGAACPPPSARPAYSRPSRRCGPLYPLPARLRGPGSAAAFFHDAPLRVACHGSGSEVRHLRVVEPCGMPTRDAYQARPGLVGHRHEPRRRPDTPACTERVDDVRGLGRRQRRVAHGTLAPFRALFPAAPTA